MPTEKGGKRPAYDFGHTVTTAVDDEEIARKKRRNRKEAVYG
ncbi:protein of unknown function [Trichlorobacter ammonificans]|uniref:Uncharacterized protein n=1 Tax=Trichlorobacter ammonificans TaxID=2916410 RepID=A0ABM9D6S2_9BACT|nr:protein of unknown function [Trichlorobacter ammonificans]